MSRLLALVATLQSYLPVDDPCGFGSAACAPSVPAPLPSATPAAVVTTPGVADGTGAGTADDPTNPVQQTTNLDEIAKQTSDAAKKVLHDTFGWWLDAPSLSANRNGALQMQGIFLGLAAIVLTLLVIWQGIRTMISRRGTPMAELLRGLIVAGIVIAVGVATLDAALLAGDQFSDAIIGMSFENSDALVRRMETVMMGDGVTGQVPMLVLVFSLIVLLGCLLQAVFLFLRQTAIPILGLLIPVAAVGQAGPPRSQAWLPRVLNLVFAIVLYKPLVAVILSLGFVQLKDGSSLLDAIRGGVTLAVAIAAFPIMLKVLAPVGTVLVERGGFGISAVTAGGVAAGFAQRGMGTPGETSAIAHANYMAHGGAAQRSTGAVTVNGAGAPIATSTAPVQPAVVEPEQPAPVVADAPGATVTVLRTGTAGVAVRRAGDPRTTYQEPGHGE